MTLHKSKKMLRSGYMWVISKGKYTNLDFDGLDEEIRTGFRKEYIISSLAKYMLNPNPIEVKKALVGCEIHYRQPSSNRIRERIRRILPERFRDLLKDKGPLPEVLMSGFERNRPFLKDRDLESHRNWIYEKLRPYNSIQKQLSGLDTGTISEVTGICEDVGGNRSLLTLKGNIDDKINYISNFVSKDVRVILEKPYISDGLFEMRGFDFMSYDPKDSYRLMKLSKDGKVRYCVLDSNNKVECWVDDINLIYYIHLLEQSIRTNPKFSDSLKLCTEGNAKPLKLLFYNQLNIDYSKSHLPEVYRDVFETYDMGKDEKDLIMNSLKSLQLGVSFNYVPHSDSGESKLFTNISVMHDFRALEPIKDNLPLLYSEINKRTSVSEAGKFYLLDSIRGFRK